MQLQYYNITLSKGIERINYYDFLRNLCAHRVKNCPLYLYYVILCSPIEIDGLWVIMANNLGKSFKTQRDIPLLLHLRGGM